jgi:D-hydroxyproline dehydrogenase subunit beta
VSPASPAVDVIVVGGGVVGAAAAAELATAGASVRLLERTVLAAGASGRNSGVVWHPPDAVLEQLYDETLAILRALADETADASPGDPFRLAAEPVGILALGHDPAEMRDEAAALGRTTPRYRPRFVDPDELRRLEPVLAPGLSAVRLDIGFPVAPWVATHAFAARARRAGAAIEEGTAVELDRQGGRVVGVRTSDGRAMAADAVIAAAGPWTPELVDPGGTWRPIRSFWGVVVEVVLADPPRHVLEGHGIDEAIDPTAASAGHPVGDVHFSLATANGRSSVGSTFLPDEPEPAAFEARIRDLGATYVPAIASSPTVSLRVCARPLALDGRPLVGALPGIDGLFIAAGHGPWGLSTGAASGRHVAGLVLGRPGAVPEAVRAAVDPARFGPIPG